MELHEILAEFLKADKKHSDKLTYNMNIIDELHANENAHTRILLKLLDFSSNGKRLFLDSFVKLLNSRLRKTQISELKTPKVFGQFNYIDGYIRAESCAIIIENKINWADDQPRQIERYVKTAIDDGVQKENIFVVYLTLNGAKKISEKSMTSDAKKMLDWQDENQSGRFIAIDYRNHILPMLRHFEKTLGESQNESMLKSAVMQYIDHLEGIFGVRELNKEYNMEVSKELLEVLNVGKGEAAFRKIEEIQAEIREKLFPALEAAKDKVWPNNPALLKTRLCNERKGFYCTDCTFEFASPTRKGLYLEIDVTERDFFFYYWGDDAEVKKTLEGMGAKEQDWPNGNHPLAFQRNFENPENAFEEICAFFDNLNNALNA